MTRTGKEGISLPLHTDLMMDNSDDNPFDVIDLSNLEPDLISENAKKRIKKYAKIIDKSDEIEFDDGWDCD